LRILCNFVATCTILVFFVVCIEAISFLQREYDVSLLSHYVKKIENECIVRKCDEQSRSMFVVVISGLLGRMEERGAYTTKLEHKKYHKMSMAAFILGRFDDARRYAVESYHFHPYYPNIFQWLSVIYRQFDAKDKKNACEEIHSAIMKVGLPSEKIVSKCIVTD